MVSARETEADRTATEAFRGAKPSTFYGSDLEGITAWISEINGLFASCHVPESIFAILATKQLREEALE